MKPFKVDWDNPPLIWHKNRKKWYAVDSIDFMCEFVMLLPRKGRCFRAYKDEVDIESLCNE